MSETTTTTSGLPEPRRRRVAPPVADPMAPPVLAHTQPELPVAAAPAPTTLPAAETVATQPAATPKARQTVERPPADEPPAGGLRRPRGQATVPLYVRVDEQTRTRFDELASASGLTARGLVEQLVAQAWNTRSKNR
ncbi:MAG: hypothetical protein BGO26_00140 [Actinobacteria bacterium 69-20]|nr:MAG: hypothetical protein BGO26_00140 [Actinobacteria bacterium 69-20]